MQQHGANLRRGPIHLSNYVPCSSGCPESNHKPRHAVMHSVAIDCNIMVNSYDVIQFDLHFDGKSSVR